MPRFMLNLMSVAVAGGVVLILELLCFQAMARETAFNDEVRAARCEHPAPALAGYCQDL